MMAKGLNYVVAGVLSGGTFCFFFIFSLLMGFNADDYWWGAYRSLRNYVLGERFLNYDGRYLGNSLAIVGFQHPWLFALIFGLMMAAIVYMFYWLSRRIDVTLLGSAMFFLLPHTMFAQTLGWKSGFFNYVLPIMPILLLLRVADALVLRDKWERRPLPWPATVGMILVLFFGSFLSEPVTLVLVVSTMTLLLVAHFRNHEIPRPLIYFCVTSMVGLLLMVPNRGYWQGQNVHTFDHSLLHNFAAILLQIATMNWLILFFGLTVTLFAAKNNQLNRVFSWINLAGYLLFALFFLVLQPYFHIYRAAIYVSLFAFAWAFVILFLAHGALSNRSFWICLYLGLTAAGMILPYMVVASFGPRGGSGVLYFDHGVDSSFTWSVFAAALVNHCNFSVNLFGLGDTLYCHCYGGQYG
jgi:hypothetical protein